MKIILRKSHTNLGSKGDVVLVKSGFARNFLIPKNIALPATEKSIIMIKTQVLAEKKARQKTLKKLEKMKDKIAGLKLEIKAKAQEGGKLFGSVGRLKIQKALEKKIGIKIPKTKIDLEQAIKRVGEYKVTLNISSKMKPEVGVLVTRSL